MAGFFDSTNRLYMTQVGLALGPDNALSGQMAGQDTYIENVTIRDIRTATHSGVGVQFVSGGGSEHRFVACEIENCDTLVDVKENSVSFVSGSTETRASYLVPTAAAGNTGTGVLAMNNPVTNNGSAVYANGASILAPPPSGANIISAPVSLFGLTPPTYTQS